MDKDTKLILKESKSILRENKRLNNIISALNKELDSKTKDINKLKESGVMMMHRLSMMDKNTINMDKLTDELINELTGGWTQWEADHLWEEYKTNDIRPYYPEIYRIIKDVKVLPRR